MNSTAVAMERCSWVAEVAQVKRNSPAETAEAGGGGGGGVRWRSADDGRGDGPGGGGGAC